MAKSSAELANWRDRPEFWNRPGEQTYAQQNELWNWLRSRSWGGGQVVNSMPHVFNPGNHTGVYDSKEPGYALNPAAIAGAIKPNSPQAQPAAQTALPADQQGILQMLINQQSPALMALLGNKSGQ